MPRKRRIYVVCGVLIFQKYYKDFYKHSITAINCSIFNNNICKLLFSNEEINNISNYKYQTRLKAKEIYDIMDKKTTVKEIDELITKLHEIEERIKIKHLAYNELRGVFCAYYK